MFIANSAIHKDAGLTVPSHSMTLPGTIPPVRDGTDAME